MTRRGRCPARPQEHDGDEQRRRLVPDGGENAVDDGAADDDGATDDDGAADNDGEADDDGAAVEEGPADDADEETRHEADSDEEATADSSPVDRSTVEVSDAGESAPRDPKWEKPDVDDIPEFQLRQDEPPRTKTPSDDASEGPTEGMPNEARSPGASRIKSEGTDGFVVALELAARLPDDVRLPDQAADLVPAAVEAELEQDVRAFAAGEFDNPAPHVDELAFVERDGEVWLRLRLGIPHDAFVDLDPDEIRSHALQELEGIL